MSFDALIRVGLYIATTGFALYSVPNVGLAALFV